MDALYKCSTRCIQKVFTVIVFFLFSPVASHPIPIIHDLQHGKYFALIIYALTILYNSSRRCELVLRELKRIQMEELQGRRSLELQGAEDPSKSGLRLPKFKLGLIEQDTEEYDERVREWLLQ